MKLLLTRTDFGADGVFGELETEDAHLVAMTLEHSYECKPKLPEGTYNCVRGTHKLTHSSPFETFEITGVPGHTGILFHWGNFNRDSDGCVLLGAAVVSGTAGRMVTSSKKTFADFMKRLDGVESFTLVVQNA